MNDRSKSALTILSDIKKLELDYPECHCGNAIFISHSPTATIDVINLHNNTAKREDHIGFILDLGGVAGWFCLHCGSRHAESDKLTELFQEWIEIEEGSSSQKMIQ